VILAELLLAAAAAAAPAAAGPVEMPVDAARNAELARCRSCHAKEYEEWLAGPHANAGRMVVLEIEDLAKDAPEEQRDAIRAEKSNSTCVDCHSPRADMFEGSIPAEWDGSGRFDYERRGIKPDSFTRASGTDCLTCHKKGDRVVTRAEYAPAPDFEPPEGFCDPIASKTFSHTLNCVSCHSGVVEATRKGYEAGRVAHCNDCHLAPREGGGRSHYYYWSANPRKIEAMIRPMFDDFSARLVRTRGAARLELDWPGDFAPHRLIPDTPKIYRVGFEILNSRGELVAERVIRFFDPNPEFGRSEADVRKTNADGELVSLPAGKRFRRSVKIPGLVSGSGEVLMTVRKKSKYEKNDDAGVIVYKREFEYGL
jgi:hypothetical protein